MRSLLRSLLSPCRSLLTRPISVFPFKSQIRLVSMFKDNQAFGHSSSSCMCSAKVFQRELTQAVMDDLVDGRLPPLIDIGASLSDPAFDKDRDAVLQRASDAGLVAVVVTGSSIASTRRAAQLCSASEFPLFFTAGVHPHEAKSCNEQTLLDLRELAGHPHCVAIGECGLDFNRNFSPPATQEQWFEEQVQLAIELRKPLFLHCRDAAERFTASLKQHTLTAPAVAHCFTGTRPELEACLDLGLHIGITGWVCDDRPERGGAELARLLPLIPSDRLMIETDSPYLVPRSIKPAKSRPRRNEPALLPHILNAVAEALSEDPRRVAERTTAVARAFFSLPV